MRYAVAFFLVALLVGASLVFFTESEPQSLDSETLTTVDGVSTGVHRDARDRPTFTLTAHLPDLAVSPPPRATATVRWLRDLESSRSRESVPEQGRTDIKGARIRLRLPARALEGSLVIRASGFAPKEVKFVSSGRRDIDLGSIVLDPGGEMSGIVFDSEGRPLSGVKIAVASRARRSAKGNGVILHRGLDWGRMQESKTNGEGEFRVTGLPFGKVVVRAEKEGFLSTGTGEITLDASLPAPYVELTLERGKTLTIRVVAEASDKPVRNAVIELFAADWKPEDAVMDDLIRREGRTNSEGIFRTEGLARRPFLLKAQAPGYFSPQTTVIPAEADQFKLRLSRAARILLTVTGSSGGSVADLKVTAKDPRTGSHLPLNILGPEESEESEGVRIGAGQVLIAGLVSQRIVLVVAAPGHATRIVDVSGLRQDEIRPVNLDLAAEVPLAGRVVTFDGRPVARAKVVALRGLEERDDGAEMALLDGRLALVDPLNGNTPTQPPSKMTVTADEEGRFRISGLGPGEFRLEASHPLHRSGKTSCLLQQGIPLEDLEIRLPVEGGVGGHVTSHGVGVGGAIVTISTATEAPVGGPVLLFLMEGAIDRCWSDPDGSFRLNALAPGAYRVTAFLPGAAGGPENWRRAKGRVVQVRPGELMDINLVLDGDG